MLPKIIDVITEDVRKIFKLDADDLFEMKMEYGISFLRDRYAQDKETGEALKCSAEFWHWWKERWAERDRVLMKNLKPVHWGFVYVYAVNRYKDGPVVVGQRAVFDNQLKEFYEDYHYWSKCKFWPNTELVKECRERMEKHF